MILSSIALCAAAMLPPVVPQSSSCPATTSSPDGCAGSDGQQPQLDVFGDLSQGTDPFLVVTGIPAFSQVIYVAGFSTTSVRLGAGCTFTVTPDVILPPITANAQGLSFLPIPLSLSMLESDLFIQVAVIDPGNPGGFALTNRLFLDFEIECVATSKLVEGFAGADSAGADAAYMELLNRGAEGIGELMLLAGSVDPNQVYAGQGFYDDRSSWRALNPVPVQRMALYVVDAILHDFATPAHAPIAYMDAPVTDPDAEFLNAFQQWWAINSGLTLFQLQNVFGPLDGGTLNWAGGYLSKPTPSPSFLGGGNGNEVPNSGTPAATCKGSVVVEGGFGPGEYNLVPATPGGPEPYNCLAYALECSMDRWTQPGNGTSMDDIMDDHGFTPEDEFIGPRFQKVELSYNSSDGTTNDGNWSHAIKVDATSGTASSKNGQGSLHTGITDTGGFRGEHYPPGPGQKTIVETFCR